MNRTLQDPKQEPLKDPLPGLKKQLKSEYQNLPEERIDQVARHALDSTPRRESKSSFPSSPGGTLEAI